MVYAIGLAGTLAALWMLLSGHTEPLLLGFGVLSVAITVGMARRMKLLDAEGVPLHLAGRALVYWPWLIKEIVKANIDVARIILSPRLPITPTMVRVRTSQRTDLGRALYANSITLTPGTVSVGMEDGDIIVHAITREGAESLVAHEGDEGCEMDRRCTWVEGSA